jgi:hypothetical protein
VKPTDALFAWCEKLQGTTPWGDVLDTGTGNHSLGWLASQNYRSLTAVTVESWRLPELQEKAPNARILLGQWTDPALLAEEQFDTLLVDYVIGAIDGHAPYFQYGFLKRILPLLKSRIYLIGMEPPPRDNSELDEICRLRDACILLAGHRCYREYPKTLVLEWLEQLGLKILDATSFSNRLGSRYINGQLDVATRKLPLFKDRQLAASMAQSISDLRERALAKGEQSWGTDWVIAAER